jgi:hypothetical protein
LGNDRLMLASMELGFMGDATDIDRVRQDLVDVPPAEQDAASRAGAPSVRIGIREPSGTVRSLHDHRRPSSSVKAKEAG